MAAKDKKEFEIWGISLVGAAQREHDGGVDGSLSIPEGRRSVAKVIVQVKGGKELNPGMVRDLMGTMDNEGAAIGLLITLEKPTSGMKELASHSGDYTSPIWDKKFQRLQILTVGEIFDGKEFDLPWAEHPGAKARPSRERHGQKPLL